MDNTKPHHSPNAYLPSQKELMHAMSAILHRTPNPSSRTVQEQLHPRSPHPPL